MIENMLLDDFVKLYAYTKGRQSRTPNHPKSINETLNLN